MRVAFAVSAAVLCMPLVQAADIDAGKAKVANVCAACHGMSGISVSDTIPNLAGQRAAYLEGQLKALKEGSRRASSPTSPTATMAAIAGQLGPDDIANVAAYFASLPGATSSARSDFLPNVAKTRVVFPEGYKTTFTKYHTINFPAAKQVRRYFANSTALKAAKEGKDLPDGSVLFAEVYTVKLDDAKKPVTGADGFFVPDQIVGYTAMQREAGWGSDFPDMLRNENWNYAVFTAAKQHRPGVNQAECLACHKPLDKASYTFTLKQIAEAK